MFRKNLALVSLFPCSETFAQNFEAILSDTRLPVPVYGMPVVYDGEDSIYVMGGYGTENSFKKDILKFNVTAETLEIVGTMDPVVFGSAVLAGNNILYFGGFNESEYQGKVWSYKPDGENNWTQIGDLPSDASFTSSVWDQGEYSYVFGGSGTSGRSNTISRYSSVTNTSVVVGDLPSPMDFTSAVWDETTGDAYVFRGDDSSGYLDDIVKFNPAENIVVKFNLTVPKAQFYSCAVWTGTEAYIIGGTRNSQNISCFIPSTNEVLDIYVNNFPPFQYWHSCAFVKKLNRIYVFSGDSIDGVNGDEIRYIDLTPSPTNPTTTTLITTTTTSTITTTTKEPINEVGRTRFPDPLCWQLVLIVCLQSPLVVIAPGI